MTNSSSEYGIFLALAKSGAVESGKDKFLEKLWCKLLRIGRIVAESMRIESFDKSNNGAVNTIALSKSIVVDRPPRKLP